MDNKPSPQIPTERWETFIRILGELVASATKKHPSSRYWESSILRNQISAIVKANKEKLKSTFPPANQVMEHLKRMGWLRPVQTTSPNDGDPVEFFLVDMEAKKNEPIYPLELLQAYLPEGVICGLSAMSYHELTTQTPSHHHIAKLIPPRLTKPQGDLPSPKKGKDTIKRNPLGSEIFRFEETAYYLNKRDSSLIPGIQLRVVSPRFWLRITTLEQTLLDALMRPAWSGGEAIIFEAWENATPRIDPSRLANHLEKIHREDLDRRVGAMLELMDTNFPKSSLEQRLNRVKGHLISQDAPEIPLLSGLEFPSRNNIWKVRVP